MLKKLNVIHIVLLVLILCVIPLVGFINGFDTPSTFIAVLCTVLLGHPILYLLIMLLKEFLILEYDTPKYMPLCMVLTILLGCLIWYLFFHTDHIFSQTMSLWYGSVMLGFAIPIVIMKVVEKIASNKNNDKPKIIRNK